MAIGFPAACKWKQSFLVDATLLRHLVRKTFEEIGWKYESSSPHIITACLPPNLYSWGEIVTVDVDDDGNISADSRCAWPLQIVDWGKNRVNLNLFHAGLLRAIRNSDLDPQMPSGMTGEIDSTPLERVLRDPDQPS